MNRDTDDRRDEHDGHDRVGRRDLDAAELFAAARAFRPSARARRRTLRALGLPVGLSLVGTSMAHAAHLLTASLKGWGMVAGIVGAAGGLAYVASAPAPASSRSQRAQHGQNAWHDASRAAATPSAAGIPTPAPVPLPSALEAPAWPAAADAAPRPVVARLADEPRVLDDVPVLPKPARRSSTRPRSRTLPSDAPSPGAPSSDGSPPPPVSSVAGSAERSTGGVALTEPPPLVPEISPRALGGPAFRPAAPSTGPAAVPWPSPPRTATSPARSPLQGELAIVSEARSLLRAGDARAARAVLDRHARAHPGGALTEEVELLRVRAFMAEGDAPGARAAGETFLQRHPASPLAARVRSLLDDLVRVPRVPTPPQTMETPYEK